MTDTENGKRAARAWTREQTRLGGRAARPVILFGLAGTALAVGQAWCMATVLAAALTGHGVAPAPLVGFAVLALGRAALGYLSELAAVQAGAAARRRLRSDALTRLLGAGPALLRAHHSGDLATIVVDRIEAVDGLFSRWVPAARLAVAGPALVAARCAVGRAAGRAGAGAVRAAGAGGDGAGRHRRGRGLARAVPRDGPAAGALPRPGARHRHHRAVPAAPTTRRRPSAKAAAELRARTMRVLRVAFLSSAALDLAAGAGAGRAGGALRPSRCAPAPLAQPGPALFALLLVPEFFAPLRGFAAAYQDRLHATGAADALVDLPPRRRRRRRRRGTSAPSPPAA